MNIHGQPIYQTVFHNRHQVDVSGWSADLYIARIRIGDSVILKKIVKQ
jgi:hypothetical protein